MDPTRPGQYGPRVQIRDDAAVQDRLIGFIGRDPAWSPPPTPAPGAGNVRQVRILQQALRPSRSRINARSVRCGQSAEHREVLDVPGEQRSVESDGGGGDGEIC